MKIKDIVNRDIVNLTNCEFEPIHIPGSIQPHGFLIAVDSTSWTIGFCSENIKDFISLSHDAVLNVSFEALFGDEQKSEIERFIINEELAATLLSLRLDGKDFLCSIHKSGSFYIIEAETAIQDTKKLSDIYSQTSQFLSYMNDTNTLQELCDMVAQGTRELTGYDRVMIYRFDKDYNGEVFAESRQEDLEPFLGLHYPHTDIPPQARELYMQNLLRLIVDINYKPVPIYTVDDGSEDKNLDLSLSILRSTSPIHVQYLQNMGVGATLTISLIHKKKLWGLVACHHYSAKNITPEIRLAAQLQGHFITSQIDVRQSNEEYETVRKSNDALERISAYDLSAKEESFEAVLQDGALLELCNAAGAAILYKSKIYTSGLVPESEHISKLAQWLAGYTAHSSLLSDKLIDYLPDAADFCKEASGIIYHALSSENNDCIIWFRPESITEVNWAGDPNKAIVKDKNGLSPRNSFKLWKEIVKCKSKAWLKPEINAAANYAHSLQKQFNLLKISEEEEKYRKLSEVLKETNSELENINWISTHDLQEPLRKIQMISSRLLGKADETFSESVINSVQRMNNSAQRMQNLLIDILKYTRIQHIDESFEEVNPNEVLEEVLSDLFELSNEKEAVINIDELPKIKGIPFLMKQLFTNLIQNSLKYSFPDMPPVLHIKSAGVQKLEASLNEEGYQVLEFSDNGIG
ncbi:MAG TPA: GAF domain-containing protein, partial [Flavobacterium sp.]|nr:GAF domain-containing protein [Flavobacterium sp.]